MNNTRYSKSIHLPDIIWSWTRYAILIFNVMLFIYLIITNLQWQGEILWQSSPCVHLLVLVCALIRTRFGQSDPMGLGLRFTPCLHACFKRWLNRDNFFLCWHVITGKFNSLRHSSSYLSDLDMNIFTTAPSILYGYLSLIDWKHLLCVCVCTCLYLICNL